MRNHLVTAFICVLLGLAVRPSIAADKKKDLDKLQGTWLVTESVFGGENDPPGDGPSKVVVAKDRLQFEGSEKGNSFRIELDTSKKPATIDFYIKIGEIEKGPLKGIYALEGEKLVFCFPRLRSEDRPTEFASPKKSSLTLIRLMRAKQ